MPRKVVPIRPASPPAPIPRPEDAERHQRIVCHIAGRRIAFDFWSRTTELKPVDAKVVPVSAARSLPESQGKQRDSSNGAPRSGRFTRD